MLMRHYEVTLIVHPDQSTQVTTMIEKYKEIISTSGGNVHREEDWGRKHLAYPINKIYKAHYLMMNIECDQDTLDKLSYNFRFNDAILRNLIISKSEAITTPSIMMANSEKEKVKLTEKESEIDMAKTSNCKATKAVNRNLKLTSFSYLFFSHINLLYFFCYFIFFRI